jgi:predicted site-specific integrase-resolvase
MSITSTGLGHQAKFLRKRQVAQRYSITPRSVERWSADGRLPAPTYRGIIPIWSVEELEASDRQAERALRKPATETSETTAA